MALNKDLDAILKAFDAIPKAARAPIKAALDKGADELVGRMQYLVPEDEGVLKASIRKTTISDVAVRVEAGGPETTVAYKGRAAYEREVTIGRGNNRGISKGGSSGVSFDYALGQEYGVLRGDKGRQKTANPFFWPSVNTLKKRVRRRVDRAIAKSVTDTWGKS